jgi:Tol biopolymer transport system component
MVEAVRPAPSADGKWVAVQSLGGGIAKLGVDGTGPIPLAGGVEPNWIRPGNLIAARAGGVIFTIDGTSGATTVVSAAGGFDDDPAWSPTRPEIAVQGSGNGFVLLAYPGGNLTQVPCTTPAGSPCDGEGPTFSPDGNSVAFENGRSILRVERTGGTAVQVFSPANYDVTEPAWSPNGAWIAFALVDQAFSTSNIWVVHATGEAAGLWQVTTGTHRDFSPAWSPDSREIYFDSNRGGITQIWRVRVAN